MCIISDASHYFNRNIFMNLDEVKKSPSYLAHLILNGYLSVSRNFGCSDKNRMIIAMDSRPTWRHEYYAEMSNKVPGYKGKKYKGSRIKSDDIPWDKFYEVFHDVHECLRLHSDFDVVTVDRAEGDDVVAVATKTFKETERVFIIGSDKDFKQLQDEPKVVMYDPIKKIFIPKIDAKFFLQKHIIIGDSGDEIDAIKPRCGEKTAEKMIKDLDRILASNAEMRMKYEFNQKMIDFNFIPEEIQENIKKALQVHQKNYNMMKLSELCTKYSLRQIFGRLREFSLPEETPSTKLNSYLAEVEASRTSIDSFFD